jgi:predicted component of type VI protein secretion system
MILAVLLAMAGRALADNLTVEAVTLMPGETKQVAISLENTQKAYAAFQFDLLLPEGISIAKNEKGKFIASLDEDRKDDHTLNVSEKSSGAFS